MTCSNCIEKDRQIAFLNRKITRIDCENVLAEGWGDPARRAERDIDALDAQEAAMGPEESTR